MEIQRRSYEEYWGHHWRVATRHEIPGIREWDQRLVDLILRTCMPVPGARVLDLGCAGGDQLKLFARKGYRVVGIDKVPGLIEFARGAFKDEGLAGELRVADMLALEYENEFDLCTLLSGTFGSPTDEEDVRVLRCVQTALRPGGKAFINYLPLERYAKMGHTRSWHPFHGGYALSEEWFDVPTSTYRSVHLNILSDGVIIGAAEKDGHGADEIIRCYGAREIEHLAAGVGFRVRAHLPGALIENPEHRAQPGDPLGNLVLEKA